MPRHATTLAIALLATPPALAVIGGDCNNNGTDDALEIDADPSLDCNDNNILDECELDGYTIIFEAAPDDPMELTNPTFTIEGAPLHTENDADVALRFYTVRRRQWIDSIALVNGTPVGSPSMADECTGGSFDYGVLNLTSAQYAALATSTTLTVQLMKDPGATACPGDDDIELHVHFNPLHPDCNANDRLDACDIADGTPDCDANGVPDPCDFNDADTLGPGPEVNVETNWEFSRRADARFMTQPDLNSNAVLVLEANPADPLDWTVVDTINAYDPSESNFARAIDIRGDLLIIGHEDAENPVAPEGEGRAYIHRRNPANGNWDLIKTLHSPSTATEPHFGASVAIDRNIAVVGATFDNGVFFASGAAHIFYRDAGGPDNWGHVKTLAQGAANGDDFGFAVDIDADIIVARDDTPSSTAFVFHRNAGGLDNWGLVTTLPGGTVNFRLATRRGAVLAFGGLYEPLGAVDGPWTQILGLSLAFRTLDDDMALTDHDDGGLVVVRDALGDWRDAGTHPEPAVHCVLCANHIFYKVPGENTFNVAQLSFNDADGDGVLDDCDAAPTPDCDANGLPDLAHLDRNNNGTPDNCDIASGTSTDVNNDGIPDDGQCIADLDGDHDTDVFDFNLFATGFGDANITPGTSADLNFDGHVDVFDFNVLAPDFGCSE